MKQTTCWWMLAGVGMMAAAVHGQWSTAVRLNDASEAGAEAKTGKVVASRTGGFHACYVINAGKLQYRRYVTSLTPPLTVHQDLIFNPHIAEGLNGDVHLVWENWAGDSPEVGWARSTNSGASFSPAVELSNTGGHAKFPYLAPMGMGTVGDMMLSYWNPQTHQYRWNRFNGGSWTGDAGIGSTIDNEYQIHGMARSPVDGTIWRSIGMKTSSNPEDFDIGMRRFNGTSWEPYIKLSDSTFFARQRVAVNDAGQVMVLWEDVISESAVHYYSMLYTPGVGAGPRVLVTTQGSWGTSLCAIPGTNDFYTAYAKNNVGEIYGRRWSGGGWLPEEQVSQGLPAPTPGNDRFLVGPDVSADPNGSGTIYCVWEYWGSGRPQQYFAIRNGIPPGEQGTVSGVVRDQFGSGVPSAIVTIPGVTSTLTAAGGQYSFQAPAGSHTISASKNFYTPQSHGITVTTGQTTTRDFVITGQAPPDVLTVTLVAGNTSNQISWQTPNAGNFSGARLVYRTDGPPAEPNDGTLLIDDAAGPNTPRNYSHTGLTNGQTYYYRLFAYYQDASRFYAGGSSPLTATPAMRADFDRDGDVDQSDYGYLQACLTGPNILLTDPACSLADLSHPKDNDVDAADVTLFLGCFSGPGVYAAPDCLP